MAASVYLSRTHAAPLPWIVSDGWLAIMAGVAAAPVEIQFSPCLHYALPTLLGIAPTHGIGVPHAWVVVRATALVGLTGLQWC